METIDTVAVLSRGGVLLLATDTLPGFHCRADHQEAVVRVAEIKGRDPGKPLLVLAGSLLQAQAICRPWSTWQQEICKACWPGPFSLILPSGSKLADRVPAGSGKVAIRVPDQGELRHLILEVGVPLVSTSVNRQGETPYLALEEALRDFGSVVDGAWHPENQHDQTRINSQPSALVDLCGEQPEVLREGPLVFPGSS